MRAFLFRIIRHNHFSISSYFFTRTRKAQIAGDLTDTNSPDHAIDAIHGRLGPVESSPRYAAAVPVSATANTIRKETNIATPALSSTISVTISDFMISSRRIIPSPVALHPDVQQIKRAAP
jgi:hypothetical protein